MPQDKRLALALALDCGATLTQDEFDVARDYCFRYARSRVLYGYRHEHIAIFRIGSDVTRNDFYDAEDGNDTKFKGIELVLHSRKPGIDALWALWSMEKGSAKVNYPDILHVAAEHVLVHGKQMPKKRIFIVSNGKGRIESSQEESVEELMYFAGLALEHGVEVTVVLLDGLRLLDFPEGARDPDMTDEEGEGDEDNDDISEDEDEDEDEDGDMGGDASRGSVTRKDAKRDTETGGENEEAENDGEEQKSPELEAALKTARRLFRPKRVSASFDRRKRLHEAAAKARPEHKVPKDATLLRQTLLCRLARVLGSRGVSLAIAAEEVQEPRVKDTNLIDKFHGLFEIGDKLKIPVKIFGRNAVKTRPSGKKVAWRDSLSQKKPIGLTKEEKLKPAEDIEQGEDIDPLNISRAFPYGDSLLRLDGVDAYALEMDLEKQLRFICFVPQDRIPPQLFLDAVDVVLPMAGTPGAVPGKMMAALIEALRARECGIAARYVTGRGGKGTPVFVYLWPGEASKGGTGESDDDSSDEDSENSGEEGDAAGKRGTSSCCFYLNMVKIPTREEVRKYPFASMAKYAKRITEDEQLAMDNLVACMDLEADAPEASRVGPTSQVRSQRHTSDYPVGDEELEPLDPSEHCNPTLERFFFAIIQRALEGGEGKSGIPEQSEWSTKLMRPSSFGRPANLASARRALEEVKNSFPLQMVEEKDPRKGQSHVEAATGIERDIAHLFPPAELDDEGEDAGDGEFGEAPPARREHATAEEQDGAGVDGDSLSFVTDCPLRLSFESPVADMTAMIRAGRKFEAFDYMGTFIPGRIEEGEFDLALECLASLRAACKQVKLVDPYHRVLETLVSKSRSVNETVAGTLRKFVRQISPAGLPNEALKALRPHSEEAMRYMRPNATKVRGFTEKLAELARDSPGNSANFPITPSDGKGAGGDEVSAMTGVSN